MYLARLLLVYTFGLYTKLVSWISYQLTWRLRIIISCDMSVTLHYRSFFLCNAWLAVDEADGHIARLIPVAANHEITGFHHLFFSKVNL